MFKSKTYIATPPGATIKEQLHNRGMKQNEFAMRMDMSEKHISNLINGKVALTEDVARKLEMVLGLPARFWNNLESIYREKLVLVEEENTMEDDIRISKKYPYSSMAKQGWVKLTNKSKERVTELRKYFEVVNLSLVMKTLFPRLACRRKASTEKADYALLAWAQRAKIEARNITTEPINLQKLDNLIPKIRSLTTASPDVFCPQLTAMLSECGIALVFLAHIGGSFLHGATFPDNKKIVVGLTVRGKYADIFWFSLFHEIAHILYDHINLPNGTGDDEESKADRFAQETLIPQIEYDDFIQKNRFTQRTISDFAGLIGIDPGIVVGRLQKENYVPYNTLNSLKTQYYIS